MTEIKLPSSVANMSIEQVHDLADHGNDGKVSREDADQLIAKLKEAGYAEEDIDGVAKKLEKIKGEGMDLNQFREECKDITLALNSAQVNKDISESLQTRLGEPVDSQPGSDSQFKETPTSYADADAASAAAKAIIEAIAKK